MSGAYGVFSKLGVGASATATEAIEFTSESLRCWEEIVDLGGISGSRSHKQERNRVTRRHVDGDFTLNPTPVDLARWLPRILGAAAVGTTFSLAETLPEYYLTGDITIKVPTFNNCRCGRAVFTARDNGALSLTISSVGKTETVGNAGTYPAISIDDTTQPLILPDLAITIGGVSYQVDGLTITIDNALNVRFANSVTATEINPTDRMITLSCRVPWGDAAALYADGAAAVAIIATFTNGATSAQFTFPAVKFPKSTPTVDDRGEQWLPIEGKCLKTGSTAELTVVVDSTP